MLKHKYLKTQVLFYFFQQFKNLFNNNLWLQYKYAKNHILNINEQKLFKKKL